MRREQTPAERRLWQGLRNHQLGDLKFRRQVPLGHFIADFYCPTAKLVVELDGVSHIDSQTDGARDAWMLSQGLRVLRFSNHEVLSNPEGVLLAMKQAALSAMPAQLQPPPPPNPLPQGEGESSRIPPFPTHV
jgi:very-short-patch-repair endonuclease